MSKLYYRSTISAKDLILIIYDYQKLHKKTLIGAEKFEICKINYNLSIGWFIVREGQFLLFCSKVFTKKMICAWEYCQCCSDELVVSFTQISSIATDF